jgi:nicotinate-nucleotide pyrophosphorylase (carboxylating)
MKTMPLFSQVKSALSEDLGKGDITTNVTIPANLKVKARIICQEKGVLCGLAYTQSAFRALDKQVKCKTRCRDGQIVEKGKVVCEIYGQARAILSAERTALNFLGHLSGIASLTRKFVEKIKPYRVKILDTRKTTPGLRELEKYAVRSGGGYNHRMRLDEAILIKDNHLQILGLGRKKGVIAETLRSCKGENRDGVEIEVANLKQFAEALKARAEIIMLDNFSLKQIRQAVKLREKLVKAGWPKPILEVSGGVNLENVRQIAACGVDWISVGALTHSAPSLDFSLEIKSGIRHPPSP